jgi:hypothetical protein
MLKRLGISTVALAAALAIATPGVTLARDRDDHRGGEHHEIYRGHNGWRDRDWDRDRRGWNFSFGYTTPVPVPVPARAVPAEGYYDQFGAWHPYNYYPNAPFPNGYYGY